MNKTILWLMVLSFWPSLRGHFLEKRVKDGGHKALLDCASGSDGAAGRWFSDPMIFTP